MFELFLNTRPVSGQVPSLLPSGWSVASSADRTDSSLAGDAPDTQAAGGLPFSSLDDHHVLHYPPYSLYFINFYEGLCIGFFQLYPFESQSTDLFKCAHA